MLSLSAIIYNLTIDWQPNDQANQCFGNIFWDYQSCPITFHFQMEVKIPENKTKLQFGQKPANFHVFCCCKKQEYRDRRAKNRTCLHKLITPHNKINANHSKISNVGVCNDKIGMPVAV